jgi:5-deoxy-glucuronate isomerase
VAHLSRLVLRRPDKPAGEGPVAIVTPDSAGWSYVGFEVYELRRGDGIRQSTGAREVCVVMLAGQAEITAGSQSWKGVGSRRNVFEGTPDSVYAPPGQPLEITASSETCEVALCWAPAASGREPALIRAPEIKPFKRGSGPTERTIHNILMEDRPAESLLVTEVLTPGGNWSSYPPHKHDTNDPPNETQLEETYYHRLRDTRGFAVQRVYTADGTLDETVAVRDGDLVLVPRGFHTVSAAPGYELYYLNVMAGPVRRWCVTFDPEHEWLRR